MRQPSLLIPPRPQGLSYKLGRRRCLVQRSRAVPASCLEPGSPQGSRVLRLLQAWLQQGCCHTFALARLRPLTGVVAAVGYLSAHVVFLSLALLMRCRPPDQLRTGEIPVGLRRGTAISHGLASASPDLCLSVCPSVCLSLCSLSNKVPVKNWR